MLPPTTPPIVTVIVPVTDRHVPLLPDALRSIANQTVPVAQVIVVNDSTKPLALGRWPFRLGLLETGGGKWSSAARNMALAKTDTPFVSFLDADDAFTNVALEVMLRAYAIWRVGYVYGDAIVMRGDQTSIVNGFDYNRRTLAHRNIHTVSALVPTVYARSVGGFDETLHGWEDWEFYMRLAEVGVCGKRVPYPIITYRLDTGYNRNNSNNIRPLIDYINSRHQKFVKGEYTMGCCGGDAGAQKAAAQTFADIYNLTPEGKVLMEYVGDRQAPVTYNANGRSYRASTMQANRYIPVDPADVAKLESLGVFVRAPAPSKPLVPHQFQTSADVPSTLAPFTPEPEKSVTPSEAPKSIAPKPKSK